MGCVVSFLTYLEVHSSILVKNPKNDRFFINFPIFPDFFYISPIRPRWANGCLGSLAGIMKKVLNHESARSMERELVSEIKVTHNVRRL